MKLGKVLLNISLWVVALSVLHAQEPKKVELRSGEVYELHNILWLQGGVVPDAEDTQALTHTTSAPGEQGKWRISAIGKGIYTIQHAETGRYLTYDGVRTAHRRYMRLSNTYHGDDSHWRIYAGNTHVIIASASNRQTQHLLNVRRDSRIVGLYRNNTPTATDNERFVLIDKKGRPVNEIDGKTVVNLLPLETKSGRAVLDSHTVPNRYEKGKLNFRINGRRPVYDDRTQTYLFPLAERDMGKSITLCLTLPDEPKAHLTVDGMTTNAKHGTQFQLGQEARIYTIGHQQGNVLKTARLSFTFMPIVEVNTTTALTRSEFREGSVVVHDADALGDSTYRAKLRWRGEYTATRQKRSIGMKLLGNDGKKINRRLGGLRTDNYWILDAMTIDPARMRNRVAMDLWHDFATRPQGAHRNTKACFASRGRLVEVFLNGKYHGIYNLCERIDRKQLQLPKKQKGEARGCLYKAENWGTWTQMGTRRGTPPPYNNHREHWMHWAAKYPEVGKQPTDWQPLYEAIKVVSATSDEEFSAQVAAHFDLPVVRDYYLFAELLLATDNMGKNLYWAVIDKTRAPHLFPVPWDLDGTWGRNWSGSNRNTKPSTDYRRYLSQRQQQSALYERLYRNDDGQWDAYLAERYRALRRTHFNVAQLQQRFAYYLDLMKRSGAAQREQQRWNNVDGFELNLSREIQFINSWIEERIAYLDRQYGFR